MHYHAISITSNTLQKTQQFSWQHIPLSAVLPESFQILAPKVLVWTLCCHSQSLPIRFIEGTYSSLAFIITLVSYTKLTTCQALCCKITTLRLPDFHYTRQTYTKLTVRIIVLTSNVHCFGAWHPLYMETLHETYKVCCIPATPPACPPLSIPTLHQPYNQTVYLLRILVRAEKAPIYRY